MISLWFLLSCAAEDGDWGEPPALEAPSQGSASLPVSRFEVQRKTQLDYVYTVGAGGMVAGDRIRIEDPVFHGIRWTKWGDPRLDPAECSPMVAPSVPSGSWVTASHTGAAASLSLSRSTDELEIHEYAWTEVTLDAGALAEGDQIAVRFGDTAGGEACGHQTPNRAFRDVIWRSFEWIADAEGAGEWAAVEPAPTFEIAPRPDASGLIVSAPSMAVAGEPIRLKVAPLDGLGNAAIDWSAEIAVDDAYGGERAELKAPHDGWLDLSITIDEPGVHRVQVAGGGLIARSNPILVSAQPPERYLYWGDIHSHHGHTRLTADGGRIDENHVYSRDVMGYDVGCESMKATGLEGPYEIDEAALWEDLQASCREDTVDGEYVALLGFEWMGNGVAQGDYGHHNLYFDACEAPLGGLDEMPDLEGRRGVFAWARALEAESGVRTIVIPHASPYTGFDWDARDDDLRTVAEIYSGWGRSLEADGPGAEPEGDVQIGLSRGHQLGFIASSDDHDGWMGNPFAKGGPEGAGTGLAAIRAPELTRAALWQAIYDRQTYATTGARILVDFTAEGEAPGEIALGWSVHGADAVERVAIWALPVGDGDAAAELLYEESPGALDTSSTFAWDAPAGGWAIWLEASQVDGEIAWASPLWRGEIPDPEGEGGCGGGEALVLLLAPGLLLRRRVRAR